MSKKKPRKPPDDPQVLGERWRGQMTDAQENLPSLVWRRLIATHRIDLADPKHATPLQVFRLLAELMHDHPSDDIDVEPDELERLIDAQVERIFKLK
jgi:hypothetical protein